MEEATIEMFNSITQYDNIPIGMTIFIELQILLEYMEEWCMKLWDQAYTVMFKGADAYKKSDSFKDFWGSLLVVKRVIFK